MKANVKVGTTGELTFVVGPEQVINIADDPDTAVLSTPALIWYLEHAAREAIASVLEPGETSVGVKVDVEHLAATPLGHEVTCRARVLNADGPVISFQVSATDRIDTIARGLHKRRVVRADRFRSHVARKMTT